MRLLCDHAPRRGARRLFRWRDHKGDPGVPLNRPVLVRKFPVGFEIEVTLRCCAQGNNNPSCGPTPTTRHWKQPTRSLEPLSRNGLDIFGTQAKLSPKTGVAQV